uniref:Transposase n=1 Tax=Haemonchus contortus TaxID=6289 RepID=A0A7I4Z2T6_HAECO
MRPSPHRATIAHLVNEGCSAGEIARRLHINDRAVRRIVAQYRERGHHLPLPKSGRPRSANVPGVRKVIKKRISRNDESIVKCWLDLHSNRFFREQMLSEAAKKNRLEKCKKLLAAVRAGRHSDIVWIDEKIFMVEVAHNQPKPAAVATSGREKLRKSTSKKQEPVPEVGDGLDRNNIKRQNTFRFC